MKLQHWILLIGLILLASAQIAFTQDFTSEPNDFWMRFFDLHTTKLMHWLAFLYVPIMILVFRVTPLFKDQVSRHEDIMDHYEERLKNKKTNTITQAEAKIVSAMAWKSAISYAVVIIATTMVIISL